MGLDASCEHECEMVLEQRFRPWRIKSGNVDRRSALGSVFGIKIIRIHLRPLSSRSLLAKICAIRGLVALFDYGLRHIC